jgi:curved DNA-binding protein CbpA
MDADELDPYVILGVRRDASLLDIARARRRLAKRHHPDLVSDPDAIERMRMINAAWNLLADPVARGAWDRAHHGWHWTPATGVPPASQASRGEVNWEPRSDWRQDTAAFTRVAHTGVRDSPWLAVGVLASLLVVAIVALTLWAPPTIRSEPAPDAPGVQENF